MNTINQIVSYINEKDLDNARKLIIENEQEYQNDIDFLSAKAMYYINTGDCRTAIAILKSALEIEPENNDLYYNLAYAYDILDSKTPLDTIDIIIKKYPKRIMREKGSMMPSRTEIFSSMIETEAPLVSIIVLAYNKLEYTKQCIESIYKYTDDVDYELIIVDNGSNDGTFEYFKSLPKRRIVRLEENQGASGGFNEGIKAARGKYIAGVCNDFIFTKNWLSNLVKCAESDDSIGFVSPGASYISNCQQINLNYSNIDEMQIEAAKYNVSDPQKWEERVRLLPNVLFVKREVFDIVGYFDIAYYYGEFADDDLSFRIRRAGYKLVFCGDTFTYHHGHVTGGIDQRENNSLEVSRKFFVKKNNGIDPWQDVKYDINLINMLDISRADKEKEIKILGIDARCGSSLLMAKNKLKQAGFNNIKLFSYIQNPIYYQDLKSICKDVKVGEIVNLSRAYNGHFFDYIIFDEPINSYYNPKSLLDDGDLLLNPSGQALVSLLNTQVINNVVLTLTDKYLENDNVRSNFSIFDLTQYIKNKNYEKINVLCEQLALSDNDVKFVDEVAKKISLNDDYDTLSRKLKVNRYVMSFINS